MIPASHFAVLLACLCALAFVVSGKDADEVKRTEGFLKEALGDVSEKHDITRSRRNDDADLRALQTIVQQQAATIQQMQSQLTASQNEISSLKNSLPSTFSPGKIFFFFFFLSKTPSYVLKIVFKIKGCDNSCFSLLSEKSLLKMTNCNE